MQRTRKPGRITLDRLFPICKYMASVLLTVSYPRFPAQVLLFPGHSVPRAVMMLWAVVLLAAAALMNWMDARAVRKDYQELTEHVRNGGMNRSTLLALGVPVLFILNCLAVIHLYFVYLNSGAADPSSTAVTMGTVAMAVGIVLWIYGAEMHHIRFGSVWGIRTKATLGSPEKWAATHKKAGLPVLLCGTAVLIAGTFLSDMPALIASLVGCLAAFGFMFMM